MSDEKLTPVFAVGYYLDGVAGNNFFLVEELKEIRKTQINNEFYYELDDPYQTYPDERQVKRKIVTSRYRVTKEFTPEDAIKEAEIIHRETGRRTVAYHYGFKERGFRPGDPRLNAVHFKK